MQFLKHNNASSSDISSWKGQDINLFQEDLQKTTKATISEKSFYNYFKNSSKKLPRVDILNILSQYCEYDSWNDFKANHSHKIGKKNNFKISKRPIIFFISFLSLLISYLLITTKNTFSFCFIDQDRNQPILQTIDITILNNRESPFYAKSDSLGCFQWTTKDDYIHFVIQSPYHKTDTIYRIISSKNQEQINIQTDDYALMLHYYANGNIEDWKNRRKELSQIIANHATIFQVLPQGLGVEIYHKDEFINKLTTPTKSLRNIEIIESRRLDGQIVKLKFRTKS